MVVYTGLYTRMDRETWWKHTKGISSLYSIKTINIKRLIKKCFNKLNSMLTSYLMFMSK